MSVRIGSARINENGTTTGGKAGDQTGGEVSAQNYYVHRKGWYVIRPKDAQVAEKIAKAMEYACANDHIGYCQSHRDSLRKAAAKYDYNPAKVTTDVETDCSALVRVCCLYAGISVGDFNTSSELEVLKKTGQFDVLTEDKYCTASTYLKRGDILVTRAKGHTVVVLSSGTGASLTRKKSYGELSSDAKKHANTSGSLNIGTRVTCKETKKVGSDIWMRTPSGWIAAYYDGKKYVG